MFYINHLSIRIKLEDVINDIEYEQTVLENIRRCNKIVGKQFRVIFWHEGLSEKICKDFVKRNEKLLFEVSTQITTGYSAAWFVIDEHDIDKCKYRYKYPGDILTGIVNYIKTVEVLKRNDD